MPNDLDNFSHRKILYNGTEGWFVRVTTMLDIIDKGPWFRQWLQTNGAKADEIAQKAADRGTLVHKVCAELLTKGEVSTFDNGLDKDESACKKVIGFKNCIKDLEAKLVLSEFEVCDGQCSGQADLLLERGEEYILADIKTGSSIYNTHYMQIMFYLKCAKVMYPNKKIIPMIIHLKDSTKKGYQTVEFTDEEITKYTNNYELVYQLYVGLGMPLEPKAIYEFPKQIKLED